MITRELKLQLKIKQKNQLNNWLFQLTGVYNWVKVILNFGLGYSFYNVATHATMPGICKLRLSDGAR